MITKILFIIGLIILCFNVLRFLISGFIFFFTKDSELQSMKMKIINLLEAVVITTVLIFLIIGYYD